MLNVHGALVVQGTDYTVYLVVAISVILLFSLQLFLCMKAKRRLVRLLPLLWVMAVLLFALAVYLSPSTGGFLDLRGAVALLLCGYAAICGGAILLAWVVYLWKKRRN